MLLKLSELFYWTVNMSIVGSICGILVLFIRKIKAVPKFAIYISWLIPLVRFWIPFGIANKYSLLNFLSQFMSRTVIIKENYPPLSASNFIGAAQSYFPIVYKNEFLFNVVTFSSVVWGIITPTFILTAFVLYFITKSELKYSVLFEKNIYSSDKISSPAVYGVLRPKIILPSYMVVGEGASKFKEQLEYILLHENVHVKRRDNLWRVVAVVTACVHWFNPLSWIFLKAFFADMELACDAKVLKTINEPAKYAEALLSVSAGKTFFASAFGGAKTRVRIENVLSYKKLTAFSFAVTLSLIILLVVALTTNAV